MRFKVLIYTVSAALLLGGVEAVASAGGPKGLRQAVNLYEKGFYSEAKAFFDQKDDLLAGDYSALCSAALGERGSLEGLIGRLEAHPESVLAPEIRRTAGDLLFAEGRYQEALAQYDRIALKELYKKDRTAHLYKQAYSRFALGRYDEAAPGFEKVIAAGRSSYQAPSEYALGYICYQKRDFAAAAKHFEAASGDPRLKDVAEYYLLECKFMQKDYAYVTRHGNDLYGRVPDERKPHLGRILSESYLVQGDVEGARKYYEKDLAGRVPKNRSDYFYAGSLLYALKDYKGAVENYSKMDHRTDSLGQIANYQLGYSQIQLKDKVSALDAFRDAAGVEYDKAIQEDAWMNWAKLSFDLNKDASVFNSYMRKYPSREKNDQIYSYMAMAALLEHDYEAAVEAYDHIDRLDEDMKSNYMKAYYLRAGEMISRGSYRDAVPLLKTAAWFSPKEDPFNQMSRYWMAESLFRDEKYADARTVLTDLYNTSALDGEVEGDLLSYNIAYTYFKEGNYPEARKWFEKYLNAHTDTFASDAASRIGDCWFYTRDYRNAVPAYQRQMSDYPDPDDLYPSYQAAVASGLLGNQKQKISFLEKARSASPEARLWSESMYELGRAYVASGNESAARKTFLALKDETRDPAYGARSLIELGMIEGNAGNDAAALDYYGQVVSAMPGSDYSESALLAIENIYQKREDPEGYLAYVNSLGQDYGIGDARKESVYFNTVEQMYLSGSYEKAQSALEAYLEKYPEGAHKGQAWFYMGECCRMTGRAEKACDYYSLAIEEGEGKPYQESAILRWSLLSYSLGHYDDAYKGFRTLSRQTGLQENKTAALEGMMRSAYKGRRYDDAMAAARQLSTREAKYILAKSCLATSRRAEAYKLLGELAQAPSTDEGAEAMYLVIQDLFDRGEFDAVGDKVYEFSGKAAGQNYWLAKAFIVLGDSFVEKGNREQARATYESILSGYEPREGADDVRDQVQIRLAKL